MPAISTPRRILECFKGAIINRMKVGSHQVRVSDIPTVDRMWRDFPNYVIVPGHCRPDGDGLGAQDGGGKLRAQSVTVHIYMKTNLDQYEQSDLSILDRATGMEEIKEQIQGIFELTTLPRRDASNRDHLMHRPCKWIANPATTRPYIKEPIIKGAVEFEVYYASSLSSVTLYQEDCIVGDPTNNT